MDTHALERKYYLDWLRVMGILTVFVYHSTRFFNLEDWHVKNPTLYPGLDLWNDFAVTWMMPLMFVVSGASLFFSVGKGGIGKFVKSKALRLLVPLVVGVFTHASLQVYLERLSHGQFIGSYLQFLPNYFQGIYDGDNPASGNFAVTGMHLWYLFWLLIFSLLLYPLLRWLKGGGRRFTVKIGDFLSLPGAVYTLMLPPLFLFVFAHLNSPLVTEAEAGWPLIVYLWIVLCGFVLISNERLLASIRRLRWPALLVAIVSFMVFSILLIGMKGRIPEIGRFILTAGLRTLAFWSFVLAFLGFSMKHLNASTASLNYANEAVLPFYILHQTVLLIVGYFVVQWFVTDLLKWVLISLVSFAIIMVLYEYLVRRFNVMRVLFGMKSIRHRPARKVSEPIIEEVAGVG
jgi:glucan biosynthesis protein C